MAQYLIANGPAPTTAAQVAVTTGTAIKTLLQLHPFNTCKIMEWGVSFTIPATVSTIRVELMDTGAIFATVTAHVDAGCPKYDSVENAVASIAGLTMGTANTGYTASAEGTITASRMFDPQMIVVPAGAGNGYVKQFPLGREPKCIIGNSVRIRVTADVACLAYAYLVVEF